MRYFSVIALLIIGLNSCVDDSKDIPKPYGYYRIELPDHEYISYFDSLCPYSFEVPESAAILDNNKYCYKSLIYPSLKAGIYFTYFPVNNNIPDLVKTADDIVYEHHNMASGIEPTEIYFPEKKVYGMAYKLMGEVAVNYVFYITDSSNHYLAGKLYFEATPNYDSLQPCIDFIEEDMMHLVESLEWH